MAEEAVADKLKADLLTANEIEAMLREKLEKAEKDQEKAEKAQEKAEKAQEKAEKDLDKSDARRILFSSFDCKFLSDLLNLIDKCELDSVPKAHLDDYTTVKRDTDTSRTFVNENKSSMTASESARDILNLNTMRRRMTYSTPSKILVKELNLSTEDALDDVLCRVFFNNAKGLFDNFVETQSKKLDKVRKSLYYLGDTKSVREVEELQPYATLVMEEFVRSFHPNAVVSPGQRFPLEGLLFVGNNAHDAESKTIKGFTDLIVHETESDADDASNSICIIELKTPKGKLYHSAAAAAKDQLFFEMEILGQMGCKPCMIIGGLTDLFAIAVAVRKVVDGVCTFYVSPRVTGSEDFIKRLLLLLCKDKDSVWEMVLQQSTEEIASEDEEEEYGQDGREREREGDGFVDGEPDDEAPSEDPLKGKKNVFSGTTAGSVPGGCPPTSSLLAKEAIAALSKLRAMDRLEEYKQGVSWLLSWDNKRKGLTTLTTEALNKMNAEHARASFDWT